MAHPDILVSIHQPRQLQVPFSLIFPVPERAVCSQLDPWLARILDCTVEALPTVKLSSLVDAEALPVQWLQRCLLFAMEFLKISRVPVFDPPSILSCTPSSAHPHKWVGAVLLPLVDLIPRSAYETAFNVSFQICAWTVDKVFTEEYLKQFDATVLAQVILPLSKRLPMGTSTLPLLKVAHQNGIPFMHLGGGVYQLGWGSNARRIDRSITDQDTAIGSKLAQDKVYTIALLRMAGLPAPVHAVVTNKKAALAAALDLGWPVVVKPSDRDRGEGVTVDVTDEPGLTTAFDLAIKCSHGKQVIVERQVEGVCHRLFIANGKLLYAVKRLPIGVTGDGQHSVAELVAAEYQFQQRKPAWKRSEIKPLDDLARAAINAAGYTESCIPDERVMVPLRRIESTNWGGINQEVSEDVHPENLRIAIAAANLFGLNVVGVDLITTDVTRPWFDTGAVINEVNFAPLLGGREVSRQYVKPFLEDLVVGNGRIPVEVYCGGDAAMKAALARQHALSAAGQHCVLTSRKVTLTPSGDSWRMPFSQDYYRVRALVLSSQVDALVLVVQSDEFLDTRLPLESVDRVELVDDQLVSCSSPDMPLSLGRYTALVTLLENWVVK